MKKVTKIASLLMAGILLCGANLNVFATESTREVDEKYKTYYEQTSMIIQETGKYYSVQSVLKDIYWSAERVEPEDMYTVCSAYARKLSPNETNKSELCLSAGTEVQRVGISNNGWDIILYNDELYFMWYDYMSYEQPLIIEDTIQEELPEEEELIAAAVKQEEEIEVIPFEENGSFVGTFELTAYCATGNPCADGVYPQVGYTVACNDSRLWHHWVNIEGYGTYYVHDTGGMASNVIDIFMGSYDECIQFGRRSANVYIVD